MALIDHLAPLRAHPGQRLTRGLDDTAIERLAKGHPDLVAVIEAAAAEHARLHDEFSELLAMDEAEQLRARYPQEMTVVIQHWYENLVVTDEGFSITLNFGNNPEPMVIPFDALRTFVDPSVEFGLRFETQETEEEDEPLIESAAQRSLADTVADGVTGFVSDEVDQEWADETFGNAIERLVIGVHAHGGGAVDV